jgi:hypothetical protein
MLSFDQLSALGITGREARDGLLGRYRSTLSYASGAQTEVALELSGSYEDVRYVARGPLLPAYLILLVDATFQSEDGRIALALKKIGFAARSKTEYWVEHFLPLDSELSREQLDRPDCDVGRYTFTITDGKLAGQVVAAKRDSSSPTAHAECGLVAQLSR